MRKAGSTRAPFLLFALKSALAAGISWEIASVLLGNEAAALAVVSAVIVVQVTSWQTVRKSIERILGVIIGVSLAILVAHVFGLNIWTITLIIFLAQIVGMFLQRHGQYLATQIPISAALALLLGASASDYPFLRLLGTLIGGLVGTIISLLLSLPIYVFRARDAIETLITQVADTFPELAHALAAQLSEDENRTLYTHVRELEQQVQGTEQALSLGFDSMRLNPWAHHGRRLLVGYPDVVLAIDRLVRQMRRIAYTINEPNPSWSEIAQEQEWALDYAQLLEEIGGILAETAQYVRSHTLSQSPDLPNKNALMIQIERAQQQFSLKQASLAQDAEQLASQPENAASLSISPSYYLAVRGAILTDLRRMLDELQDIVRMTSTVGAQLTEEKNLPV